MAIYSCAFIQNLNINNCTPGRIRTPNPLVRSQVLYPIKPRAQFLVIGNWLFVSSTNHNTISWGTGIRTPTGGTRIRCPAIRRCPNFIYHNTKTGDKFMSPVMKCKNVFSEFILLNMLSEHPN